MSQEETRRCKVCGFTKFEFILEQKVEEPGRQTHDVGYYKCKRCGSNEKIKST